MYFDFTFRLDSTSDQSELFTAGTIPEEIAWWFEQHDTKLSQSASVLLKIKIEGGKLRTLIIWDYDPNW